MKTTSTLPKKKLVRKRGVPFSLQPRDCDIMKYIWRWKIASTRSVHEAMNKTATPYTTYKILDRLERNHMVEGKVHLGERFHVWQLTELGFQTIKYLLGELKEEGFRSENHRHDRFAQAFQFGEWATYQFPSVAFCTEQELRRKHSEHYPEWAPKACDHRADGYTQMATSARAWTFAYEVELSAKNVQAYESVLRTYRSINTVDQVLWLVDGDYVKNAILKAKATIKDDSFNYHVFVDLKDFIYSGWDAVITNERSERLTTMREKYQRILGETGSEILENSRGKSTVSVHFEKQKVIGKSNP